MFSLGLGYWGPGGDLLAKEKQGLVLGQKNTSLS